MMERPVLPKPRFEQWVADDEQLANLLDNIDKKILNVDAWEFWINSLHKSVKYDDLVKNIREKHPGLMWVEAMSDAIVYLPVKFRIIKEDLFSIFKRFTLNLQERLGYIESVEEYIDYLEERIGDMASELASLNKERVLLETKKENVELTARLKEVRERLEKITGTKPDKEKIVEEKEEVVKEPEKKKPPQKITSQY